MPKTKKNKAGQGPKAEKKLGPKTASRIGEYVALKKGYSFDDMLARSGVSEDGRNWLITAIDPYHDWKRVISGYPDSDPSASVVSCFKYSADLAAPGAAAWDAHIFSVPNARYTTLSQVAIGAGTGPLTQSALLAATGTSFLNIYRYDTSSLTGGFPISAAWNPTNFAATYLPPAVNEDIASGFSRVVAAGFEVVNTTPQMYRGGRVTAYSQPNVPDFSHHRVTDLTAGNLVEGTASYAKMRSPPASVAAAVNLLGSLQWGAEDGIYMPIPISSVDNPFRTSNHTPYLFQVEPDADTFGVASTAAGGAAATVPGYSRCKRTNTASVGCMFTDLSPETTLTVTLRVYVERIPTAQDRALAVLATPSAPYDVRALELYSELLGILPIATKVGNNANGDWFRNILKKLRELANPVRKLPVIGALADKGFDAIDMGIAEVGKAIPFLP